MPQALRPTISSSNKSLPSQRPNQSQSRLSMALILVRYCDSCWQLPTLPFLTLALSQDWHLGPGFQGFALIGCSRASSSVLPSTLRYSSSAQRSSGCSARPITPSWRQPSRNSWPRLLLPLMLVSNKNPPGNSSLSKPICLGLYSKLPTQN